jgi:hypothetical protein
MKRRLIIYPPFGIEGKVYMEDNDGLFSYSDNSSGVTPESLIRYEKDCEVLYVVNFTTEELYKLEQLNNIRLVPFKMLGFERIIK